MCTTHAGTRTALQVVVQEGPQHTQTMHNRAAILLAMPTPPPPSGALAVEGGEGLCLRMSPRCWKVRGVWLESSCELIVWDVGKELECSCVGPLCM